jgi:transcriptional regulator with AAA-type ATPase domain
MELASSINSLESRKEVYFDGSNTTNRILDLLEEKRPKIICIDELDKMPKQFQEKLLNFLESGRVKFDQVVRTLITSRDF